MAQLAKRLINSFNRRLENSIQKLRKAPGLHHYVGFDCPQCSTSVGIIPEATFGKGEFNSHEDAKTLASMKLWVCPCCEAPYVTAPTHLIHAVNMVLRRCCTPGSEFELKVLRPPQHIRAGKIRVKRRCTKCGITRHTHCYVPRLGAMISLGDTKYRRRAQASSLAKESLLKETAHASG